MKKSFLVVMAVLILGSLGGCGGDGGSTVAGKARFVQGGSAVTRAPLIIRSGHRLTPGDQYIISPNKAKITFKSVVFKGASGSTLATSTLTDCVVTYDRTKSSGTSLLDCPFDVPTGEIGQMSVAFSTTLQLYVDDTTTGIYSSAAATGGFSTTRPSPEPDFVDFLVTAGASSNERSTSVIFSSPITVAEGSLPEIYITTDMVHTTQIEVTGTGTTLGPITVGSNDPVALFGGLTKGTSLFYSEKTSIDSYKVMGVNNLRVFYDAENKPLYLIGSNAFCGSDGGYKAAWASAPVGDPNGAQIGGWLGKDATNVLAWALPMGTNYSTYNAYFTMQEQTSVGGATTLNCKASTSPPEPTDGKTYASGAPAITGPTTYTLNLLAK